MAIEQQADTTTLALVRDALVRGMVIRPGTVSQLTDDARAAHLEATRLQALIKTSEDWYWEVDRNLNIQAPSEAFANLRGIEPTNPSGKSHQPPLGYRDDDPSWNEPRALMRNHEAFRDAQIETTTSDGSVLYVSVSGQPKWNGDLFDGYLCVGRNITARKLAQTSLLESEKRLRLIIDNAQSAISVKTTDGHLTMVNETFCRWFETNETDACRRTVSDFLSPSAASALLDYEREVAVREQPPLELEILFPDGKRRWIQTVKSPVFDGHGRCTSIITIGNDVSEKKLEESRRSQSQKLESLGLMAGGIAHDFNNILVSTLGFARLAAEHPKVLGDAKLAQYINEIELAGERARRLIEQMLTFARPAHRAAALVSMQPVVEEAVSLIRSMLPSTIQLRCAFSPTPNSVLLNETQLHQLVVNLCLNARDANEGVGEIEIALESVQLTDVSCSACHEGLQGDYVELSVRDTGTGIAREDIDRIFDPFYTTKPVGEGSGLGLSVVHGITHANGGHIIVQSAIGEGSVFCIVFPVPPGLITEPSGPRRRT
ncbi:MAG: PAS domain S-box protein [Gammaproteobacteria bacterium]|nr:PAS domain S-box protein [Gammaproteobacteria bacterium]